MQKHNINLSQLYITIRRIHDLGLWSCITCIGCMVFNNKAIPHTSFIPTAELDRHNLSSYKPGAMWTS